MAVELLRPCPEVAAASVVPLLRLRLFGLDVTTKPEFIGLDGRLKFAVDDNGGERAFPESVERFACCHSRLRSALFEDRLMRSSYLRRAIASKPVDVLCRRRASILY